MTDTTTMHTEPIDTSATVDADALRSAEAERTATEHWNARARLDAVPAITDQAVLAQVVIDDWSDQVRAAVARKLTDVDVLRDVAAHDESEDVRSVAQTRVDLLAPQPSTNPTTTASTPRPPLLGLLSGRNVGVIVFGLGMAVGAVNFMSWLFPGEASAGGPFAALITKDLEPIIKGVALVAMTVGGLLFSYGSSTGD